MHSSTAQEKITGKLLSFHELGDKSRFPALVHIYKVFLGIISLGFALPGVVHAEDSLSPDPAPDAFVKYLRSDLTVTIPGDYGTLQEAIDELSGAFLSSQGAKIILRIESGHRPSSGIIVEGGDFGHFRIRSEDDEVKVGDEFAGDFLRGTYARLPMLETVIDMNDKGDDGVHVREASSARILPASGVRNAGANGVFGWTGSIYMENSIATGSAIDNLRTSTSHAHARFSDLSRAGRNNVHASYGSSIRSTFSDLSHAGSHGVYAVQSRVIAEGSEITHAGQSAVFANRGSAVHLSGTDGSTDLSQSGSRGIFATNASTVEGEKVIVHHAGGDGVRAEQVSTVSVSLADIRYSSHAIVSTGGSRVESLGAAARDSAENQDLLVLNGGVLIATGTETTHGSPALGDTNVTEFNLLAAIGIIFDDELETEKYGRLFAYDFGSGVGKTGLEPLFIAGSPADWSVQENALRFASQAGSLRNAAAVAVVESYEPKQDFSLETEVTLVEMGAGDWTEEWQRFGLAVLGGPHSDEDPLSANSVGYKLLMMRGQLRINDHVVGIIARENWDGVYENGAVYHLEAEGIYNEDGSLILRFTVTDHTGHWQRLTSAPIVNPHQGNTFGLFGRDQDFPDAPPAYDFHYLSMGLEGFTPPMTFAAWRERHFTKSQLDDPGVSGPKANPAGDGAPNLLKYAVGLDPFTAVSLAGVLESRVVDGKLQLSYLERADANDIDYIPEMSLDLVAWASGPGLVEEVHAVLLPGDEFYRVTVQAFPGDDEEKIFLRLRVIER